MYHLSVDNLHQSAVAGAPLSRRRYSSIRPFLNLSNALYHQLQMFHSSPLARSNTRGDHCLHIPTECKLLPTLGSRVPSEPFILTDVTIFYFVCPSLRSRLLLASRGPHHHRRPIIIIIAHNIMLPRRRVLSPPERVVLPQTAMAASIPAL